MKTKSQTENICDFLSVLFNAKIYNNVKRHKIIETTYIIYAIILYYHASYYKKSHYYSYSKLGSNFYEIHIEERKCIIMCRVEKKTDIKWKNTTQRYQKRLLFPLSYLYSWHNLH